MTFSVNHHLVTQARELFEMAAFLFFVGVGTLIWAYCDYRRLKTWKRFTKADSLRLLIVGLGLALFSAGWFWGGIQALRHGHP